MQDFYSRTNISFFLKTKAKTLGFKTKAKVTIDFQDQIQDNFFCLQGLKILVRLMKEDEVNY